MDNSTSKELREQARYYFLLTVLLLIVITVLFMVVTDREVPQILAIQFPIILAFIFGVKTPERVNDNGDTTIK